MVLLALGYRRGVFGATPAGARYGFRLNVPPPQNRNPSSWLLAISIELDDPLLLAFLAVCSARCPDYDGAAANFAASVNLNTCNALPSSRTHQFLFARPPPCVLLMCCVPWCCARAVVLFQSRVACCFMLVL